MANPRRLIGIFITLSIVGALGFFGWRKVQAASAKKTADSIANAGGKLAAVPRPDSLGRTFDAGAAIPVIGVEVKRGDMIMWVTTLGEAESSQRVPVQADAGGRVESVRQKEFDIVRTGDTLIMLDTTELVFALRSAQNSVNRAKVQYDNQLISDHLIADPEIRRKRAEAVRASSGLVEAELSFERAKLEYSKAATRAPSSGRVANVKVVPGQRVGSGTEIMTIVAMDPIRVNAQVLQTELGSLKIGNQARLRFPFSDSVLIGRIESINPIVETGTRTARVTVTVRNPNGDIVPGMTAKVELQSRTYHNRLMVPSSAILQRSEGRDMLFVYMPNKDGPDGITDWRYVAMGLRNSEFVEIVPGTDGSQKMVEPGEIVIIAGHYTLEHQSPVKLVDKLGTKSRL
jgi:RND family efflux transporter MFP subunit